MTRDDATVLDLPTNVIPAPRSAETVHQWAEPGQFPAHTRPSSEYWDVETARWVSRPPVPAPRQGG
jgi:hypothetical protein